MMMDENLHFTDVLKGLLDENAILIINKSDLLEKEKLIQKLKI